MPFSPTIREQTLADIRQVKWAKYRCTMSFSMTIQKTTNQIIADYSKTQMPFTSFKTLTELTLTTRLDCFHLQ